MISVIVPIHNSEKYMVKCIDSILSQTYTDFELILIDDGSSDNSPKICDEYAVQDNRIVVIHKKNGGVSSARNNGIIIAKGEFITFVDSDDYIEKDFLLNAIEGIKETDMYLSGITMEYFEDNKIVNSVTYSQIKSENMTIKELLENLEVTYPQICICGPCCKLYKSKIIKSNNILFDEKLNLGEDTLFNLQYYKNIKNVYFDMKTFYHYRRINGESLFSSFHPDTYEKHVKVYDTMRELIKDKNCSDESIKKFENLYTSLLIGCIHHVFKFSKEKKDRIEIINKVVNNNYVKLSDTSENIKNRFITSCVKKKRKKILFLVFSLRYLN